jgi:hypothetical protein
MEGQRLAVKVVAIILGRRVNSITAVDYYKAMGNVASIGFLK